MARLSMTKARSSLRGYMDLYLNDIAIDENGIISKNPLDAVYAFSGAFSSGAFPGLDQELSAGLWLVLNEYIPCGSMIERSISKDDLLEMYAAADALPDKTTLILDECNLRTYVGKEGYYSTYRQLDYEILRIIRSVEGLVPADSTKLTDDNGQLLKSTMKTADEKDAFGRNPHYVSAAINDSDHLDFRSDGRFLSFISYLIGDGSFSREFMTINNSPARMLMTDRILLYSALLNFRQGMVYGNPYMKAKIEDLLPDNDQKNQQSIILNNQWDRFSDEFRKFLKAMTARTIHY